MNDEHDTDSREAFDSPFFRLNLSSIKACCETCQTRKGSLICTSCRVGCYCSRKCQKTGWMKHKKFCEKAKSAWKAYYEQEQEYLNYQDDGYGLPVNFYVDESFVAVGIWGVAETGKFNNSLLKVVQLCGQYRTAPALKHAVLLTLRYLCLNRRDGTLVRHLTTEFLLQLGQDQLAYDFIRFWGVRRSQNVHISVPYLYFWGEDLSEGFEWNALKLFLQHEVSLLLIKLRYYERCCDREAFQKGFLGALSKRRNVLSSLDGNGLVLRHIYSYVIAPGTFSSRKFTKSQTIKNQIDQKIADIEEANPIFFRALLNPGPLLQITPPVPYRANTPEEAYFTLVEALPTWKQNLFALEYILHFCMSKYGSLSYPVVLTPMDSR